MTDRAGEETAAVKRLLILLLLKLGATSDEIGTALGISGQRVRQIVPSKAVAKLSFVAPEE